MTIPFPDFFPVRMLNESKCHVFSCSKFVSDRTDSYERDLVNRVILAVEHGDIILLFKTDRIDENFYDLFNQFYTPLKVHIGSTIEERYLSSISIGGSFTRKISEHPNFQCIVIRSGKDITNNIIPQNMPPPFLNRFEKYRLGIETFYQLFFNNLPSELSN